jgi:hypothetical protein
MLSEYSPNTRKWSTTATSGLPACRPIEAICFASPPFADARLAALCAIGSPPLVTSLSAGSDLVPRLAISQIRQLRKTLGRLHASEPALPLLFSYLPFLDPRTPTEAAQHAWQRALQVEESDAADPDDLVPAGRALHVEQDEAKGTVAVYEVGRPERFYRMPWLVPGCVAHHMPVYYLDCMLGMCASFRLRSSWRLSFILAESRQRGCTSCRLFSSHLASTRKGLMAISVGAKRRQRSPSLMARSVHFVR